jgi:hypothetical protein
MKVLPVLPARSVAITPIVFAFLSRTTDVLKVPPLKGIVLVVPFRDSVPRGIDESLTVPETVWVAGYSTAPSEGDEIATAGAVRSNSIVDWELEVSALMLL